MQGREKLIVEGKVLAPKHAGGWQRRKHCSLILPSMQVMQNFMIAHVAVRICRAVYIRFISDLSSARRLLRCHNLQNEFCELGPIAILRPLKMFPQGSVVRCVLSTKEPVLAVVLGPSPHGGQYRSILYKRGSPEVVHDRAGSFSLSLFSSRGTQKTDQWMQCTATLHGGRMDTTGDQTLISPCCVQFMTSRLLAVGCQRLLHTR